MLTNLNKTLKDACIAGKVVAQMYMNDKCDGKDQLPCGFAWIEATHYMGKPIDGRSKVAKQLIEAGFERDSYTKRLVLWNPSGILVQSVNIQRAGCVGVANYLNTVGLNVQVCSRLD